MLNKNFGVFFKKSRDPMLSPWKQVGLGGESGARQGHTACFRGLRTHLQLRLPRHKEAFGAWEEPTRL